MSPSPPTPKLSVLEKEPTDPLPTDEHFGVLFAEGPDRRDHSSPGRAWVSSEVWAWRSGRQGAFQKRLSPGLLALLGGTVVVSAFAEAATAKEEFNLEPAEPGRVCRRPPFSRARPWPWEPGRAGCTPVGSVSAF